MLQRWIKLFLFTVSKTCFQHGHTFATIVQRPTGLAESVQFCSSMSPVCFHFSIFQQDCTWAVATRCHPLLRFLLGLLSYLMAHVFVPCPKLLLIRVNRAFKSALCGVSDRKPGSTSEGTWPLCCSVRVRHIQVQKDLLSREKSSHSLDFRFTPACAVHLASPGAPPVFDGRQGAVS